MSWTFRPPTWALAGTVGLCAVFCGLGLWQLHRGDQKKVLQQQYAEAVTQAPTELIADSAAPAGALAVRAQARGTYLVDRQLLLDGQGHGEASGYDVWTPLRLADGGLVIVNRGWVAETPDRRAAVPLDAPAGEVSVQGLWRSLPEPGVRLGGGDCLSAQAGWPLAVVYPTIGQLRCLYRAPMADGELLLDADTPGGYLRDWQPAAAPGFPPERHYAYAVQWFAFAAILLGIFLKQNLKRSP